MIRAKIEQCNRELDNFEELVKKTINAKAKATLWLCSYIRKTDQHCLRTNWPELEKTKDQGDPIRNLKTEEPKAQGKLASA